MSMPEEPVAKEVNRTAGEGDDVISGGEMILTASLRDLVRVSCSQGEQRLLLKLVYQQ